MKNYKNNYRRNRYKNHTDRNHQKNGNGSALINDLHNGSNFQRTGEAIYKSYDSDRGRARF